MVDFQSGLWYSEKSSSFCMWYQEKPESDNSYEQPAYTSEKGGVWEYQECSSIPDDRMIVHFLLTSWS